MPFLSEAALRDPHGPALEDGDGTWSYGALFRAAEDFARRLLSLGLGRGDVVAVDGPMDRDLLCALHGIWMAGGAVAPLNGRWTRHDRDRALEALEPGFLLVRAESGDEFEPGSFPSQLEIVRFGPSAVSTWPHLSHVDPSPKPLPRNSHGDEAARLLTSGTSGSPRVVRITVGNLRASAQGSRGRLELEPSDRWLGSLAISHVGGVALVTRTALLGSCLVLRGAFDVQDFMALAEAGSITHASLVPTMLHRILEEWGGRAAPPSLRCLLIGGAPISEALEGAAVDAGFPVALTYGLTEASSQVATAPPELVREKPGTVGHPLPGVEVEIDERGEILVRGPTVAPGQAKSDGWLHTGDLGRLDASGHLRILGRLSDRIISGGVNVDPVAVERVLEGHPEVEAAAVVGVPDQVWGERVVAAIVTTIPGTRLEEELLHLARTSFSPPNRPRSFRFLEILPRNPNGKVDRYAIRSLFL